MSQDMVLFADSRRRLVCGITDELFNKDTSIKILDVGAGTGIAGEMVRFILQQLSSEAENVFICTSR